MPLSFPFRIEPPPPINHVQWSIELLIGFVLLAAVVGKFIIPFVASMLSERTRSIREAADQVEKTLHDTEALRNDYRQRLDNIAAETQRRMEQAVGEAQALRAQILAEADTEARAIVQRGQDEIERERAKVAIRIHREFVDDVIGAAAFAMRQSMDERLQQRLVADFVARVRVKA